MACHGVDGKGAPQAIAGFKQPDSFPDFTRCDQTTAEENIAYQATITYGGPYRGFSQIMPSFSKALTQEQITEVVHYLRTFCNAAGWPRGELNLPRAIATEKAYPEDEEVVTAEVNARGTPGITNHIIHEQRFGMKNQLEVDVPLMFQDQAHTWYGGVGDTVFGVKRVLFSSLRERLDLRAARRDRLPTGSTAHGLGSGTTTFGTFGDVRPALPQQHLPAIPGRRESAGAHRHRTAERVLQQRHRTELCRRPWAGPHVVADGGVPRAAAT